MNRDIRQIRTSMSDFTTAKDGDTPHISGYFAVFNCFKATLTLAREKFKFLAISIALTLSDFWLKI